MTILEFAEMCAESATNLFDQTVEIHSDATPKTWLRYDTKFTRPRKLDDIRDFVRRFRRYTSKNVVTESTVHSGQRSG